MRKHVSEWTEEDLLSLPAEGSDMERKGASLLDLTLPRVKESDVLNEMAKQLSAFANTGGGRIVYGLTDDGSVDQGGISRTVRGRQPTKEWIEDIVPTLTEFEVLGVNVYEVLPSGLGSTIAVDKALYIVDVPDSSRAPHQSRRDSLYYVRIGSKSRPAPHRIIEDIRTRAKFPNVEAKIAIRKTDLPVNGDGSIDGLASVLLDVTLVNCGTLKCGNCCVRTESTLLGSYFGNWDNDVVNRRAGCPGFLSLWTQRKRSGGPGAPAGCSRFLVFLTLTNKSSAHPLRSKGWDTKLSPSRS